MPNPKDIKHKINITDIYQEPLDLHQRTVVSEVIEEDPKPMPKAKKHWSWKLVGYLLVFGAVAAIFFSSHSSLSDSTVALLKKITFVDNLKNLADGSEAKLKGEETGRINILLLGVGGKNHDGGYLSDTIMLVSLDVVNKRVAMVSVPRDLTVPVENMGWRKINSVSSYAEQQNPGSGGLAVSQAVSSLFEIPIDYYLMVDFQGFINIIDKLGGVTVEVENTLDDYSYPVLGREDAYPYNSRFEHLHVEKGTQTMDGSLALKYARSRHGVGIEGSDFARARRQQLVIGAVKDQLMSMNVLFKPTLIAGIISEVSDHISTNLKVWEMAKLWTMFKDTDKGNIINKVLDDGPNGFLKSGISEMGAYILLPRTGSFAEIRYMIANVFELEPKRDYAKIKEEKAAIELRNGTWINGLASRISVDLEKMNLDIAKIGNNNKHDYEKTVIYDFSNGTKPETLDLLKKRFKVPAYTELPEWLKEEMIRDANPTTLDFLIILGRDADVTSTGSDNPEDLSMPKFRTATTAPSSTFIPLASTSPNVATSTVSNTTAGETADMSTGTDIPDDQGITASTTN